KIVKLGLICNAFPEWHLHARPAEPCSRGRAPTPGGVAHAARRAGLSRHPDRSASLVTPGGRLGSGDGLAGGAAWGVGGRVPAAPAGARRAAALQRRDA